jgi:hypothetical protein
MLKWDTAWRALRDAAGLPGLGFHDLRHTVITGLAEMASRTTTDSPGCPTECGQRCAHRTVGGVFWGAINGWITNALIRKRESSILRQVENISSTKSAPAEQGSR